MILVVFIPGEIVATARARMNHGTVSTPRKTVEYQSKIARAVRAAMIASQWPESFDGRVRVAVSLHGENPQTDPDNVLKGALDGLVKARALRDDRLKYVRDVRIFTVDGPADVGMRIEVTTLDASEQEARC